MIILWEDKVSKEGSELPVIKYLAAEHMSSDAPTIRPAFLLKPMVTYGLFVEVVYFVA